MQQGPPLFLQAKEKKNTKTFHFCGSINQYSCVNLFIMVRRNQYAWFYLNIDIKHRWHYKISGTTKTSDLVLLLETSSLIFQSQLICTRKNKTYHMHFTLSFKVVKHYGFAAAPGRWPWWTDKHPDEGIHRGSTQGLSQAEKVRGLACTNICSSLIAQ